MAAYTRLFDLIPYQLSNAPQDDCLATKEDGKWRSYSTQEVMDTMNKVSRAFIGYGIKPDDKIALISNNRPEWNFTDLGMLQAGAVNIPIYPTISEQDYKFIFNDAEVRLCFVSDKELYDKVANIKDEVPSLEEIYTFDHVEGAKHWSEFLEKAEGVEQEKVDEVKKTVEPDNLATIIYTSGTTGQPKGVMLSHNNIAANVRATLECLPIDSSHKALSFLPMCHIFERMVIYTYMAIGASIYYAESLETIADDIKEVKPHFFTSVPRLLEKVYEKIVNKGLDLSGFKRKLFFWALELGHNFDVRGNNGFWYNFKLAIARKLIFSKWQEALGGNLIGIVTGAAALQLRLERVFNAAGIMVRQGYGQTETSPVLTFSRFEENDFKLGTVGYAIPGVEVKLGESDEILAKGPNIMLGYYKRPDLTAQTIDSDGWLHTGDVGRFEDGKYLRITDRVKQLFKTSGGKYVAPQVIENKMKESSLIEQIMIVGENQKFVGALIVPAWENLKDWCKQNNVEFSDPEDMVNDQRVIKEYQRVIEEYNPNFSHIEQVKRFKLMPKEWSIDSGELTPTMKVKRKVIIEKYQDVINDIYNV